MALAGVLRPVPVGARPARRNTARRSMATTTIGRAPENDLQLADRTVSRQHARLELWPDGPLRDRCRLDVRHVRERPAGLAPHAGRRRRHACASARSSSWSSACAAPTRPAARCWSRPARRRSCRRCAARRRTRTRPTARRPRSPRSATQFGMRPRVRSGWALKRLDASEGERRFILKDLRSNAFVRMTAGEAELFELLDGSRDARRPHRRRRGAARPHRPGPARVAARRPRRPRPAGRRRRARATCSCPAGAGAADDARARSWCRGPGPMVDTDLPQRRPRADDAPGRHRGPGRSRSPACSPSPT